MGGNWQMDLRLNPVAQQESYRLFAIKYLPRLRRLDGREVTDIERSRADCLFANLECSRSPSPNCVPRALFVVGAYCKCLLPCLLQMPLAPHCLPSAALPPLLAARAPGAATVAARIFGVPMKA
jgi:hypothetical protein